MAETSAMWVHGQAAVREWEPRRWFWVGQGPEFIIDRGKNLWVHLAIPTPVLLKGKRATLRRVHVLYSTYDKFSVLKDVHIRDGQTKLAKKDNLNWWGDHQTALGPSTTIELGWDGINYGIGVSLNFAVDNVSGAGEFSLRSVGGDFEHNW